MPVLASGAACFPQATEVQSRGALDEVTTECVFDEVGHLSFAATEFGPTVTRFALRLGDVFTTGQNGNSDHGVPATQEFTDDCCSLFCHAFMLPNSHVMASYSEN
jgi:hypothetical protein